MWEITENKVSYKNPISLPMAFRELYSILRSMLTIESKVTVRVVCRFCTFLVKDDNYLPASVTVFLNTSETFKCRRCADPYLNDVDRLAAQIALLPLDDANLSERIRTCLDCIEARLYMDIDLHMHCHNDMYYVMREVREIAAEIV